MSHLVSDSYFEVRIVFESIFHALFNTENHLFIHKEMILFTLLTLKRQTQCVVECL